MSTLATGTTNTRSIVIPDTALPNIIQLKDVCQVYEKKESFISKILRKLTGGKPLEGKLVFDNLNLLVEDQPGIGQFVVILGPTGCGKSTVLRYIAGLQTPTLGTVELFNAPVTKDTNVGMVFQQYSSFPWRTVTENIRLGLEIQRKALKLTNEEMDKRVKELIALVGLEGHENKYAVSPNLSGGQLQRVAIARSLACDSKVLLMDEPFGALDIHTKRKMQNTLLEIWERLDNTIIFVTHDIPEAVFLGTEIWVLSKNGSLVDRIVTMWDNKNKTHMLRRTPAFQEICNRIEDSLGK